MEVTWINGNIEPPEKGEYCIAAEALQDMEMSGIKKGDIEIYTDYYEGLSSGGWDTIGKNSPYWKVVCWARIVHPNIPVAMRGRVVRYFGIDVREDREEYRWDANV